MNPGIQRAKACVISSGTWLATSAMTPTTSLNCKAQMLVLASSLKVATMYGLEYPRVSSALHCGSLCRNSMFLLSARPA